MSIPNSLATDIETTSDTFAALEQWRKMAWDRFNSSPSYSELHSFYEGYGTALDDALGILKPVEEVAKKSHGVLKAIVIASVLAGALVVLNQRYKNQAWPFNQDRE